MMNISTHSDFSETINNRYDIYEYRHAGTIFKNDYQQEYKQLTDLLRQRQRLTPPQLARLKSQEQELETLRQYKEKRSYFLDPIDPDILLNDADTE